MGRQKMPPEYFLNRIREFQKKNGRAPRSNEFSAPFHRNMMKHFGSWQKAVYAALGVKLNYARRNDAELLAEISNFVAVNKRIPNHSELKCDTQLCSRFGSYAAAVEAAIGFNPQTAILKRLRQLTSTTSYASLYEIAAELKDTGAPMTQPQVRGLLGSLVHSELVEIRRGDRIALYKMTSRGVEYLKSKEAKRGNRA
jgi:hypothetical protein